MDNDDSPQEIIRELIPENCERAVFAGGCFWCLEANLQILDGVEGAINGYAGGPEYDPTYEAVYTQKTGHREAVMVYFDPAKISYGNLLEAFWHNIDPTDTGGQFHDRGPSYRTAVFYLSPSQKATATNSRQAIQQHFDQPIATEILPYTTFYEAEDYHQDFYRRSPQRYQDYAQASGREEYKQLVWQAILRDQAKDKPG